MAKLPWWIKQLLSSYQPNRNFLDGSRICREAIETNSEISMDRKCDKIYRERKKEGLNRCETIELDKKEFFQREENTKRWMQTSKLLKHRSNQHVKFLKASLNQKKKQQQQQQCKSFIDPKHTHTHTHNKSNRFYISKTS